MSTKMSKETILIVEDEIGIANCVGALDNLYNTALSGITETSSATIPA